MKEYTKKIIGREKDIKYLCDEIEDKSRSSFIMMYGRRRLGKTTILQHVAEKKKCFYFQCTQESVKTQLGYFKDALHIFFTNPIYLTSDSSFVSYFQTIIQVLPKYSTLIIDEFPYLIGQDKSIVSQFQKIYDLYLKDNHINVILCGSSLSIMTSIQSYSSPLYGRKTGSIHLKGLSLYETRQFLTNVKSLEEVAYYHLLFGGVPYYLEQINQSLSLKQNIDMILHSVLFRDEPIFLLKEEFKETRNYLSILSAISLGKNKFSQIADSTFIDKGTLSTYLYNLEELGLTEVVRSFFDKPNSKKTHYKINDNFLYFYFSILKKYQNSIQNNEVREKIVQQDIPRVLGRLFEREVERILRKNYYELGTYFNKEIEIDLLGKIEQSIDVIECKFQRGINEKQVVEELKQKIEYLPQGFDYIPKLVSIDKGITLLQLLKLSK